GQNIVHRVYTTKGLKEQGRFALEVSVKALAFFARCFGFDMAKIMSKMDHVALPEFEMGAMENWGLITYRSVRLLVDPKSSGTRSKMLVAEVVCHELAHQWFGNLTSPDWWMYLWLNEGFATWAASLAVDHVFPEWKIWDQFVTDDLGRALQLDSLRSSHPIQVDVVRAADISQIFDAISYAKGCAVIRMLVAHLTLDKFLDGLKTYFQRHKFGNAATDDLWSALSDASGIDVKTFMDLWTLKVGHPLLTVEEVPAGDKLQLHISQHRYLSTNDVKPDEDETLWWVSLDVIVDGEPAPRKVVLTERKTVVDVPASARFYKLNADTTGIYRVRYPASAIPKLGVAISSGALTVGDRAGIVADMAALAESGHISTTDFLDVLRYFANEQSEVVLREIATRLNHIISIFYESPEIVDGLLALRTRLFKNHVERLGWEVPAGGEKIQDTLLRVLAVGQVATAGNHATVLDEAKRRFSQFFASGPSARDEVAIDPSLRPHILSAVVRHTEDAEAYDHVLAYARDESVVADQSTQALAALGATRNPQLIERLLRESLDSEVIRSQDIVRAWQGLAANHEGRRPLWQLVKREWPAIYERFKHSMNYLGLLAKTGIQNLASSKDADEIEAYFASQKSDKASMSIKQSIEKVRVNAAQVQRDHAKVFDWIKRQ
ncbi:zincin, partial [Ramicandelaber brevisporus]